MSNSQTTYPRGHLLYEIASGDPIPSDVRVYFQQRALNNIYDYVLRKFLEKGDAEGFTKAALARRIEKGPDHISRLLGAPGNWTIETISDLLLGIAGEEFLPSSNPLKEEYDKPTDPNSAALANATLGRLHTEVENPDPDNLKRADAANDPWLGDRERAHFAAIEARLAELERAQAALASGFNNNDNRILELEATVEEFALRVSNMERGAVFDMEKRIRAVEEIMRLGQEYDNSPGHSLANALGKTHPGGIKTP